jgi:hypothetical protein
MHLRAQKHVDRGGRMPASLRTGIVVAVWLGAAMLVSVTPAVAGSIFGPEPVPDWVKTAVAQKLPAFPGKPKAVVLLDETIYTVGADGRATEHVRRVVKILRPTGTRLRVSRCLV